MGAGREQFVAGPRDSVRPVSHAALLVEAAQEGAEEQELSEQVGGGAEDEREGTQSTEEKEGQKHHRRALHYSLYTRDHVQMLGELPW